MTIESPLWMQNLTYAARLDRGLIESLRGEGVGEGLAVSQRGAGANMSVDIAAGTAFIQGDDQSEQGVYRVRSTAVENLTGFVAASSTQRIDGVDLRINDPNAGGPAGNTATLVRTAGTESASPSVPAVPSSAIRLATVGPFTTSTASVTTGMITDVRAFSIVKMPFLTAVGDIPIATAAGTPARLAKGTNGLPLLAGSSTVAYGLLTSAGISPQLMQTGVSNVAVGNASVTVTFGTAFPGSPRVFLTGTVSPLFSGSAYPLWVASRSSTQFTAQRNNTSLDHNFEWLAVYGMG